MNKGLSRFAAWCAQELIWGGELLDRENLPDQGPAVFVCNHVGALGPIAVYASLPFCLHFWIHADMLDPDVAADYVRQDFVEKQLHIPLPYSRWVAPWIAKIHVPLLSAIGGVPVYHTPEGLHRTFERSVDLLAQGAFLLIFPEDPEQPMDAKYHMQPFKKGFTRLGELYHKHTGRRLAFYPLTVHARSLTVRVGQPVVYNPLNRPAQERMRIKNALEYSIREMYREAESAGFINLPLTN